MHFSEDDIRSALRREDPGPGFTQRVMAKVGQAQEKKSERKKAFAWRGWSWRLRPALAAAAVALVLAVAGGLGYQQYERIQEKRLEAQRLEDKKAKEAEQQVILALRITNAKLQQVLDRVNKSTAAEPKIRRRSL